MFAPDNVVPASAEHQVVEGEQRQDAASVTSQDPARTTVCGVIHRSSHKLSTSRGMAVTGHSGRPHGFHKCDGRLLTALDKLERRGLVHADGGVAAG